MKFELGPDLVIDSDDTRVQQQGLRIAVIGQSGAGKSWTIALLAEQALEQRLPVVIVDPPTRLSVNSPMVPENSQETSTFRRGPPQPHSLPPLTKPLPKSLQPLVKIGG